MEDFIALDVNDLPKTGIIRKSKYPYNNPLWVVDKKVANELGNRNKRLVINFRKLKLKTIADKYPMPSIMILANLARAKYLTTLDLKSGYHELL